VSVLLRAVDKAPNYQQLEPQCGRLQLREEDQVFVAACDSSVRPSVVVRSSFAVPVNAVAEKTRLTFPHARQRS
jgi:hypothetical protein